MRLPSTKTLIVLAVISLIGCEALAPMWYPGPMPVIGSDGLPMHGADGKILVHRDMAKLYRMWIPSEVLFVCGAALIIWLVVRFLKFLFGRYRNHTTVAYDAICQFVELRDAGKLPGLARDDPGQVEAEAVPQTERVKYPVSVVLHKKVEKDHSRLSYTLTKESRTNEWRLAKAWRTKPDGRREDLKVN
jgi:hypothetical protein